MSILSNDIKSSEGVVPGPLPASTRKRKPWYRILYMQVLIAMALGIALGHWSPLLAVEMKPFGDGFIKLVKMIIAPVISEKATMVGETRKQVVFEVVPDATKAEIKAAVELLFKEQKVQVGAVNVVNVKGKEKRHGRFIGRRKAVKKAYVSLIGDADINFVEGVA